MSDIVKIKLELSIGFPGAKHEEVAEIPKSEIDGLSPDELQEYLNDYWKEWSNMYIDGYAGILEEGEDEG